LKAWREHGNSGIRSQPFACPEEVVSKTTPKARPPSPDDSMSMGRLSNTTTTITSQPVKENYSHIQQSQSHTPSSPELSQIPGGRDARVQMPEVQAPGPGAPESPTMDFYEGPIPGWPRILREIKQAKDKRHHELLLIERRRQKLEERRRSLERQRYELEVREARVLEAEPFLPVARWLQDLSIGVNEAIPWIETIQEVAQNEKIDFRMAAYRVAQELRSYRQFGGLQKSIQQMEQRLAMLTMFAMQKERALMVLMELQNRGVSLDEIHGLSKIIDLDRLGKEWNYGVGQSNDSGNNSSSRGNGLNDLN